MSFTKSPEPFVLPVGHYIWPLVWIESAPSGLDRFGTANSMTSIDFGAFADTMVERTLADGRLPCRVERDGLVIFDFGAYAPRAGIPEQGPAETLASLSRQVEVVNSHLACLMSAVVEDQGGLQAGIIAATPHSFLFPMGSGVPGQGVSYGLGLHANFAFDGRFASAYTQNPATDGRLFRSLVRPPSVIERSLELLDTLLCHETDVLPLVDLLYRAAASYSDHDFSLSLIQSWAVTEALLGALWRDYLDDNRTRPADGEEASFINHERRKNLERGKDMTASVVTEILSLVDRIPFKLYQELGDVRRIRNRWLHELTPVDHESAHDALATARGMLYHARGLDLQLHPPLTWTG